MYISIPTGTEGPINHALGHTQRERGTKCRYLGLYSSPRDKLLQTKGQHNQPGSEFSSVFFWGGD